MGKKLAIKGHTTRADELKPIGYCTMPNQGSNDTKKIAWFYFWDNDFADKVELDLTNRELIQENGKWFVVKKKPVYPTTYEECNRIMCVELWNTLWGEDATEYEEQTEGLINALIRLKVCRDAYWKIAGEAMRLGKPWKPQFENCNIPHYCIFINHVGEVCNDCFYGSRCLLAFPTAEMRDAFYDNFKSLIELCKDLL